MKHSRTFFVFPKEVRSVKINFAGSNVYGCGIGYHEKCIVRIRGVGARDEIRDKSDTVEGWVW